MARLLRDCGVKFYTQVAGQYPAELIEARVAEWEEEVSLGPGMLVKMIQQGGPVMEALPRDNTPPASCWECRRFARWSSYMEAGEKPPPEVFQSWTPMNQEIYVEHLAEHQREGDR
jgi:hypothetical protein